VPAGGASTIAQAMVPLVEAAGGAVVTGADVAAVILEGGRAAGVRLATGQEVRARTVRWGAGGAGGRATDKLEQGWGTTAEVSAAPLQALAAACSPDKQTAARHPPPTTRPQVISNAGLVNTYSCLLPAGPSPPRGAAAAALAAELADAEAAGASEADSVLYLGGCEGGSDGAFACARCRSAPLRPSPSAARCHTRPATPKPCPRPQGGARARVRRAGQHLQAPDPRP
jgi:hypothetical protein